MKRIMAVILYAMVLMGASFAHSWVFEIQDDSRALPAPPGAVEILFFSRCFWVFSGVLLTWGCNETLWGCSGECSVGYPPGGNYPFLCIHALDSMCAGRRDTIEVIKIAEGDCLSDCSCVNLRYLPFPEIVEIGVYRCY